MGTPEKPLLALRLQRRAYASIYEGAKVLAAGVSFLSLVFVLMYLLPALMSLTRHTNINYIETAPPTLLLFDPYAQAAYLTFLSSLSLLWQLAYPTAFVIGGIFLNSLLVGGVIQIDRGLKQLRRLGLPGLGLSGVASKVLLTGDIGMIVSAIFLLTVISPNNLQESPTSISLLTAMDFSFALMAIGLLLTGAALWRCGKACGHSDVKEGGIAIVIGMAIFLVNWLASIGLLYQPVLTPSRPGMATLLYLSSMLPVNNIVSFALAFAGATKTSYQARELMRGAV